VPSYDSISRRGWNGPYVQHTGGTYTVNNTAGFTQAYGENGDPTVLDGWGRPIVLQRPSVAQPNLHARLVSAGPDGVISTPTNQQFPAKSSCGDDLVLYLRTADQRP
jgi:hypothetical protein